MVCVRPAVANGLVFNGSGALALNVMGSTPEPVGACGYAEGPTEKLPFNAAGGADDPAGHNRRGRGADDPANHG